MKDKWIIVILIFTASLVLMLGLGERPARSAMESAPWGLDFDPAADTEGNTCVLNQFLGVSEQLIGPLPCASPPFSGQFFVNTGEWSIAASRWVVNAPGGSEDFPLIYPEDYEPNGTPAEDALSKFAGVTLVLDDRKIYFYPMDSIALVLDAFGLPGLIQISLLPKFPPQKFGTHQVEVIWVISEMLCDGIGVELEVNCLSPGEYSVGLYEFEVVPRARQSE